MKYFPEIFIICLICFVAYLVVTNDSPTDNRPCKRYTTQMLFTGKVFMPMQVCVER